MADSIRNERGFITMLRYVGAKPRARKKILQRTTIKQIKVFSELAYNALYGVLPLSKKKRNLLKAIKPLLRFLSSKKKSMKAKRQLLIKKHPQVYTFIYQLFSVIKQMIWLHQK